MALSQRFRTPPSAPAGEARARVVDRLVLHQGAIDFRTLCERAIDPKTRYVVLDLDRTFHFGHNIGELLGWEVGAYMAYGASYLQTHRDSRKPSRFLMDGSRPLAMLRYVARGARLWAYPGLFYFFMVKMGTRIGFVRPWLYRRFGVDPVEAVQQVPRTALMHHLSDVPMDTLRELSRDIWRRYEDSQVIQAADLAWLRERCPGIKIIISSASPQPVLEAAAAELHVDDIFYTAIEEHDGYLSSPYSLSRLFMLLRPPRRISPPSRVHVNAGEAKMAKLLERFPDFADPDVHTVGITDTSYGEDHAWANYFKTVIDINSPAPFAPIVAASSPLREIHSARVMTRAEIAAAAAHPRRDESGQKTLLAADLARQLERILPSVEALLARYSAEAQVVAGARSRLEQKVASLVAEIEREVGAFNAASGEERRQSLGRLYRYSRIQRGLHRQIAKTERRMASLTYALTRMFELSRRELESSPGVAVSA